MKRRISFRSSKTANASSPSRSAGAWPPADRALASRGSWDWLAFPHQARVWPEVLRAARPALLVCLALVVLGGVAVAVLQRGKQEATDDEAEIRLLAEAPSPNLNSSAAAVPEPAPVAELVPPSPALVAPVETPRVEVVPAPTLPVVPVSREPVPLEPARPEPPRPLDASVVIIPANAPALENDAIDVRASQLGDTPMIHEWKMLGLQTILAGALVAATTGVAPAEADKNDKGSTDVKKDDVSEQFKALQGQLKTLTDAVQQMGGAIEMDVKKIQSDISRLSGDVLDSKVKADKASKGVDTLTAEVERLKKELESLRTQVAAARVSNYPQAPTSTGRLKIVNTFTTPVSVVVNNKVYRDVMPGETRFTDVLPSGTISYEVLGITAMRNTHLDPNEILTLNVYTR
jgi:outer membrane murein-binding lipoprotein Lpp